MADQPARRKFRLQFSLRTLLLTVLFGGSAALLWMHWEPWRLERSFAAGDYELSADGRKFAWQDKNDGNRAKILDLDSGAVCALGVESGEAADISFCPDPRRLISSNDDNSIIRIWDTDTGACVATFPKMSEPYDFFLEGPFVFAFEGPAVNAYDTADGRLRYTLKADREHRFVCHGKFILTHDDNSASLWDAQDGRLKFALPAGAAEETGNGASGNTGAMPIGPGVVLSPDGQLLAVMNAGVVELRDIQTGAIKNTLSVPDKKLDYPYFSPDSKSLLTPAYLGNAFVWDVATGKQRFAAVREQYWQDARILGDGKLMLESKVPDPPTAIVDLNTGVETPLSSYLPLGPGEIFHNSFRNMVDDEHWAVSELGKDVVVWDFPKRVRVGLLKNCLQYSQVPHDVSPGGRHLLARDNDGLGLWIWSVEFGGGQPLGPYPDKKGAVYVKFSEDEKYLAVTWDFDDAVRLFKLRRPESRFGFLSLPEFWLTLAFAIALGWSLRRGRKIQ